MNIATEFKLLQNRLRATARQELLWYLLRLFSVFVSVCSIAYIGVVLLEWWLHGTIQLRTLFYYLPILLGIVAALITERRTVNIVRSLLWNAQVQYSYALRVGRAYPDVSDMLCNVMQLQAAHGSGGSQSLTEAAFDYVSQQTKDKDFSVIIDKRSSWRIALYAIAVTALFIGLISLFSNSLGAAYNRIDNYNVSYLQPAPFTLYVAPKSDTAMRGQPAIIRVLAHGVAPISITLWVMDSSSDRYSPFTLQMDSTNRYSFQIAHINSTTAFYAESPWLEAGVRSDTGQIAVIDRPLIRSFSGTVSPPSYTQLSRTDITDRQPDITALRGSVVDLTLNSNKTLRKAFILLETGSGDSVRKDTNLVPMRLMGSTASGRFSVSQSCSYHFVLEDEKGMRNVDPVKNSVIALSDAHPSISLRQPTKDVDIDPKALLPMSIVIADDFGFSHLTLMYRLAFSKYAQAETKYSAVQIPIDKRATSLDVAYVWNLAKIGITTDDVYEFYLEVFDNDIISGPKSSRTGILKVRHPSMDEMFGKVDEVHQEVQKDLKELVKETEQIKKEAEELQRDMQKQQSQSQKQMQYTDKKKAEELLKRQEQLQKKMEEAAEKIEEMTQKLQENNAISKETLEKYMELQKLMREVKSPELERMQQQMKKALEQVSPEEMEKMMKQFKFNEEEFRKNIERTMNLLKRTQAEQKADELAKRAEELARKQDELRQKTENSNGQNKQEREKLANEQKQLKDEFNKLAQETKELEKLMKEIGQDMPTNMMEQAKEQLQENQTKQEMNSAQSDMEKGDMQDAGKSQKQASENMQRFAQQMKQLKKEMRKNAQRETMKAMQKGMNDLLELSKEQEALKNQMQQMDAGSSQFPQAAQRQRQIQESMQNLANSMMSLGQKSTAVTPEMAQDMGDALQNMQQSMQNMADRDGQTAASSQSGAMSSMNSAAQRMSDAMGGMMSGESNGQGGQGQKPGMGEGKGMSPFQRLQNLADQQQSINEGSQQIGQSGQQSSEQQRAEMGRLASQQGKALKAMQELEQEQRTPDGSRKPQGDLRAITEDMKEVMTDMQTGNITPQTRMRQERILSRLLNASRSMNERDHDKTRESTSGIDGNRSSPGPLDLRLQDENANSLKDLFDKVKLGYTRDYENVIRLYLESIKRQGIGKGVQ